MDGNWVAGKGSVGPSEMTVLIHLCTSNTTILRPFFRDHPGEPMLEQNFWTLWCKGRLTEADTTNIRLDTTPSGLTSAHLHNPPFLQSGCLSFHPTNSVKVPVQLCINNITEEEGVGFRLV